METLSFPESRRRRSARQLRFLLSCLVVLSTRLTLAGSSFKVGSFAKTTAAASVDQTVAHGLGVAPKALILWTESSTDESFATSFRFGFGFTDGTTSKSASAASEDAQNSSNASRRMANKAITIVQWGQALVAEADWKSWDSTNFTLTWTTNNASAYTIHFIAIGGTDISASVIEWTMPSLTGNQQVTGVGFKPNVVIHLHAGYDFTNAPPSSAGDAAFSLGVMDADGDQWATIIRADHNSPTSDTARGQQTDSCIYDTTAGLVINKEASWVSMDSDGFTVNFTTVNSGANSRVLSLALKGLHAKPGSFSKTTAAATASQSVTGVGFTPSLVLLSSFQDTSQASPVDHARFGLGASDGSTEGCSALQDTNGQGTTSVDGIDKTSKVFVKVNNNTPSVDAEADMSSLNSGGFTLSWTTNDSVATEILYLALGSLSATDVEMTSFTATWEDRGTLLEWRTGHEVDNLGFHVWRYEGGDLVRITPCLLAGSALLAGAHTEPTASRSYSFLDLTTSGSAGARYWLEDVDLHGARTFHGPVDSKGSVAAKGQKYVARSSPVLGSRAGSSLELATLARAGARRAAEPPERTLRRIETQWALAAGPSVKLSVLSEGWCRVSQVDLVAAGLDPSVDPRRLRLFAAGQEVPFTVNGERDGRLDPQDSIELYALGIDIPSSDARVYWLMEGSRPGRRLRPLKSPRRAAEWGEPVATRQSFPFLVEVKPREIYFAALKNGDAENFFGPVVAAEPAEVILPVHHLDPASPVPAVLEIALQGVTAGPHHVQVLWHGARVAGILEFAGQVHAEAELHLPLGWLEDGENSLVLRAEGGETDVSLVDSVRLTYGHTYTADDDWLRFSVPAWQPVTVRGFTNQHIRVLDVTRPDAARLVEGVVRRLDGGGYAVRVVAPGSGGRTLLAVAEGRAERPAGLSANRPSRWHVAQDGADLVIVAPRQFEASLEPLRAQRQSDGYAVAIVDIEDLYDEFSFGIKDPQAIKDFLARARAAWRRPPRFLLLVGDATFDPRGYLGEGERDLLPTWIVETEYLETASDDWFADFDEDGVPELAVGRLPARTVADVERVVSKLVTYSGSAAGEGWSREALLVADDGDAYDFHAAARHIGELLPAGFAVRDVILDAADPATARAQLIAELEGGQLLVTYLGHGSVEVWAREEILNSEDVAALRNGPRWPVVVAMSCLNGFFHDLYTESLAEALLKAPEGGAIAVWASSGLTSAPGQSALAESFVEEIFGEDGVTLGEAARRAKSRVDDPDLRRTWVLFGDPTLKLR